jgi:demethylmenaquinone methyltransferase/2-methoxy-6-polyprenyl-1,4-benzoquinol methylase
VLRPESESLVQEQMEYYRLRAPEYDDWWLRVGVFNRGDEFERRWEQGKLELHDALRAFAPAGDVLELACGTGNLTLELAACDGVDHITALDSSPETMAIAATKLVDPSVVTFETADLFAWEPPRRFDVVAFGFWLSHVPVARLKEFWGLVDRALQPDGRVFLIDNAVPSEVPTTTTTWLDEGVSLRTLNDGRQFYIVKRGWTPAELEDELAELGWSAEASLAQDLFIYASCHKPSDL